MENKPSHFKRHRYPMLDFISQALYAIFVWLLANITKFCCKRKAVIHNSDYIEYCQTKIAKTKAAYKQQNSAQYKLHCADTDF